MDVPEWGTILSGVQIGMFIFGGKMLFTKVTKIGDDLTRLWAEHNTYKELSKCPLVRSTHED